MQYKTETDISIQMYKLILNKRLLTTECTAVQVITKQ